MIHIPKLQYLLTHRRNLATPILTLTQTLPRSRTLHLRLSISICGPVKFFLTFTIEVTKLTNAKTPIAAEQKFIFSLVTGATLGKLNVIAANVRNSNPITLSQMHYLPSVYGPGRTFACPVKRARMRTNSGIA